MALITTYKHDYIDPREMLLNYKAKSQTDQPSTNSCNCVPENDADDSELANELNGKCGASPENEGKSEWTGVAPMGLLIKARVIPNGDQNNADDDDDECSVKKPNRYLKNLPNSNPSLYDNLRKMNKDDLSKILNNDRLKSTYQIDYGGVDEFNTGTYGDDEQFADSLKAGLQSSGPKDPCTEDGVFKDHRSPKKCYRPVYRARVCCKHCPAVRGHWKIDDKLKTSEYNASIGEIGGLIMKEKLNDHSKCTPKKCNHAIMFTLFKDKRTV